MTTRTAAATPLTKTSAARRSKRTLDSMISTPSSLLDSITYSKHEINPQTPKSGIYDPLSRTSDNTLSSLPLISHPDYYQSITQFNLTSTHAHASQSLIQNHFDRNIHQWIFELSQGFSILLVGFGSKFQLVQKCIAYLHDRVDLFVVNGFHPLTTIKSILTSLSNCLQTKSPSSLADHHALVLSALSTQYTPTRPLVLIIHSIDAIGMNEKGSEILCSLASHDHVRLITSADHVRLGLLWDMSMLLQLNFVTHHVATFHHYLQETRDEPNLMVQKHTHITPDSVLTVLSALPPNSRACFVLFANLVLALLADPLLDQSTARIPFSRLLAECQKKFFVSGEPGFRTIITEFVDHLFVVSGRLEGVEMLSINLSQQAIESVLESLQSS